MLQAAENAQELEAEQLPLVYWAFATLGYCPSAAVLALLDGHVLRMASQLSAQVIESPLRPLLELSPACMSGPPQRCGDLSSAEFQTDCQLMGCGCMAGRDTGAISILHTAASAQQGCA